MGFKNVDNTNNGASKGKEKVGLYDPEEMSASESKCFGKKPEFTDNFSYYLICSPCSIPKETSCFLQTLCMSSALEGIIVDASMHTIYHKAPTCTQTLGPKYADESNVRPNLRRSYFGTVRTDCFRRGPMVANPKFCMEDLYNLDITLKHVDRCQNDGCKPLQVSRCQKNEVLCEKYQSVSVVGSPSTFLQELQRWLRNHLAKTRPAVKLLLGLGDSWHF